MKTPKILSEMALKHMIGHYGGMILLFLLKFSYFLLALTIAFLIPLSAGTSGISGILIFILVCIIFYVIYQPLIISEGKILYREICGKSVAVSNIFSCYTKKDARNRSYEIAAGVFLRKITVAIPVLITEAVVVYFTVQTVGILGSGILSALIIFSAALTTVSLLILYSLHTVRFFAVNYINAIKEGLTVKQMIAISDKITRDKKNYILSVLIRVIPLYILTLLIFPAILTIPYIDTVRALTVKELIENYGESVI
jgi:hypothetical protein